MAAIQITPSLSIDESTLDESFIQSSGPGGQNVNKVASAVQLRFDAKNAGLPFDVHARLEALAGSRLTKDGAIIITARQFRDQQRNREDARARLVELIRAATVVPKKRKKTRPTRSSIEKRIEKKKGRSEVKKQRSKRFDD
ncbi:MAG TPA: alternative ribosome rescue aminoacyl-tRNA hydrolase ArfB [Rhizomicrobium sp.]|jgi:ribosome-associated protein|nr:alternative ribosome rescue aminoacyl-tRNA hydrolase ArfB [Rhizomicrobium sp.]